MNDEDYTIALHASKNNCVNYQEVTTPPIALNKKRADNENESA